MRLIIAIIVAFSVLTAGASHVSADSHRPHSVHPYALCWDGKSGVYSC